VWVDAGFSFGGLGPLKIFGRGVPHLYWLRRVEFVPGHWDLEVLVSLGLANTCREPEGLSEAALGGVEVPYH
jgi:hypothetical protein